MTEPAATATERPESGWMFFPGYEYQWGTLSLFDPGIDGIADPMKLDFYKNNFLFQAIHQGSKSPVGGGLFGGLSLSGIKDRNFSWDPLATPDCTDAAGHPGETDPEANCYMDYARYTTEGTSLKSGSSSFGLTVGGILTQQVKPWFRVSERLGLQLPLTPHGIDSAEFFLDAEDDASLYFLDSVRTTSGSLEVVASLDTASKKNNGLVAYVGFGGSLGSSELSFTKDDTYLAAGVTAPERVLKGIFTTDIHGIAGLAWRFGKVGSPAPEVDDSTTPAEATAQDIIKQLTTNSSTIYKQGISVEFIDSDDDGEWDVAVIDLSGLKGDSLEDDNGKRVVAIYIKKNPDYDMVSESVEYFVTATAQEASGNLVPGEKADLFPVELKQGELEAYITKLFTQIISPAEKIPAGERTSRFVSSGNYHVLAPMGIGEVTEGTNLNLGTLSIIGVAKDDLPENVNAKIEITTGSGKIKIALDPVEIDEDDEGQITLPWAKLAADAKFRDLGHNAFDVKVTITPLDGDKWNYTVKYKIKQNTPVVSQVQVLERTDSRESHTYGYQPMTSGSFGVGFESTEVGYATIKLPNGYTRNVAVKKDYNEVVFKGSQDSTKPPEYLTNTTGNGAIIIQVTDSSYNPLPGVAAVNGESVNITAKTGTSPSLQCPTGQHLNGYGGCTF